MAVGRYVMGQRFLMVAVSLVAAWLMPALNGSPASAVVAGPDPDTQVIAPTVNAHCAVRTGAAADIRQKLDVTLTAQRVVRSKERYATCSQTIVSVRKIIRKSHSGNIVAGGFRCVASWLDPDRFSVVYACSLRNASTPTRVQLGFELILD